MKAFLCVVLLATVALAAPEGKRDKRSGWLGGYSSLSFAPSISSYSLSEPIISHSVISKPAIIHEPTIVHEPAVVSVKKIVEVPRVVSVKKVVSVPRVVSVPHVTSHISSVSYEPTYSSGWW